MTNQRILSDQGQPKRALSKSSLAASIAVIWGALAQGSVQAQTSEYQWWSKNVFADDAHIATLLPYTDSSGITRTPSGNTKGSGTTIAVVDTGVFKHSEFIGRLLSGADFTTVKGGDGTNDQNGHGTHVAGIASAGLNGTGVVGIAPDAYILPIRVLDAKGSGTFSAIVNGINYGLNYWSDKSADRLWQGGSTYSTVQKPANQNVIFSMSFGAGSDTASNTLLTAMQSIASKRSIAIIAAGNDGATQPAFPARYVTASGVAGFALAVGAVDSNNNMPSWSNKAGDQQDYYIVAPGVGIYSTYKNGSYTTLSGTSMATPVVSGAASVVWGAWPYLSGDKVIKSLLWSASDLGPTGVDTTYGWGLLNVNRALQPLGSTCATTGTQPSTRCSYSSTSSSSQPSGATQLTITANTYGIPAAAGTAVAQSDAKVVGYDQLGRAFYLPIGVLLKSSAVSVANNMNSWMANSQPVVQTGGSGKTKFSVQGDPVSGINGFSYTQAADYNGQIIAFKGNGVIPFGLSHSGYAANTFVGADTLKIPYLGLMESPTGIAYGKEIQSGMTWRVGYMAGGSSANQFYIDPVMPQYSVPHSGAAVAEISARRGPFQITASTGRLQENGAFLGAISRGVQSTGNTWFSSLSTNYDLGLGFSVLSTYSRGVSAASTTDQVAQFKTITQSYSVGLLKQGFIQEKDQFGFSIAMPSRVSSGSANLQAGVGVNWETGDPIFGTIPVSLVPNGRETRYEFSWNSPLRSGNLGLTAMRRLEPNHDASAKPDNVVGARLTKNW